jgi:hypothetical protein
MNPVIKKEIRSFCQELEEQFYSVMEKLIQFYSSKVIIKNVTSKDSEFPVPSIETCGLLNILGLSMDLATNLKAKSIRNCIITSGLKTTEFILKNSTP